MKTYKNNYRPKQRNIYAFKYRYKPRIPRYVWSNVWITQNYRVKTYPYFSRKYKAWAFFRVRRHRRRRFRSQVQFKWRNFRRLVVERRFRWYRAFFRGKKIGVDITPLLPKKLTKKKAYDRLLKEAFTAARLSFFKKPRSLFYYYKFFKVRDVKKAWPIKPQRKVKPIWVERIVGPTKKYVRLKFVRLFYSKRSRWKWHRVLKRIYWKFKRIQRLKKKEYMLRIIRRVFYKKYYLKPNDFRFRTFLEYSAFCSNRLEQVVMNSRLMIFKAMSRYFVRNNRILVNNFINSDINYTVSPYDVIRINVTRSHSWYSRNRSRRKRRYSRILKKWRRRERNRFYYFQKKVVTPIRKKQIFMVKKKNRSVIHWGYPKEKILKKKPIFLKKIRKYLSKTLLKQLIQNHERRKKIYKALINSIINLRKRKLKKKYVISKNMVRNKKLKIYLYLNKNIMVRNWKTDWLPNYYSYKLLSGWE